MILTLQSYWAEQGCAILQPYDMEVGAGTLHPATTLRALGPKPWRAAYVQPSRRPKDGRYGENPNRLQHYYQFQVILKPNPPDLQELYLNSLARIGIDPLLHDIRFVEDDWENPTVGAWGLGWEVWCDGMEVSQYTYFQQVGGLDVRPVIGRADLRARAAGDVRVRRRSRVRPAVQRPQTGKTGDLRRCVPGKREAVVPLQFRTRRSREGARWFGDAEKRVPSAARRRRRQGPTVLPAFDQR